MKVSKQNLGKPRKCDVYENLVYILYSVTCCTAAAETHFLCSQAKGKETKKTKERNRLDKH